MYIPYEHREIDNESNKFARSNARMRIESLPCRFRQEAFIYKLEKELQKELIDVDTPSQKVAFSLLLLDKFESSSQPWSYKYEPRHSSLMVFFNFFSRYSKEEKAGFVLSNSLADKISRSLQYFIAVVLKEKRHHNNQGRHPDILVIS